MLSNWSSFTGKQGLALALALASVIYIWHLQPRQQPTPERIWRAVQAEASRHDLDPHLVWAICWAESSLRPDASSGKARGLMQLTQPAWQQVRRDHYLRAWDWQENLKAGCAYLAWLRAELPLEHGSARHLAAAYRHGPGALARVNYDLSRLPAPKNLIYREIFAGNARPGPPPPSLE